MQTSYCPGSGSAVVGTDLWCLVDVAPGTPLTLELLDRVTAGDASGALSRLQGSSQGYVIVKRSADESWSVSARGSGRAVIASTLGSTTVEGTDALVTDPSSVTLELGSARGVAPPSIPHWGGLVPASELQISIASIEPPTAPPATLGDDSPPAKGGNPLDEEPPVPSEAEAVPASPWVDDDFSAYDRYAAPTATGGLLAPTPGVSSPPPRHEEPIPEAGTHGAPAAASPSTPSSPPLPVEVPNPGVQMAPAPTGPAFLDRIPFDLDEPSTEGPSPVAPPLAVPAPTVPVASTAGDARVRGGIPEVVVKPTEDSRQLAPHDDPATRGAGSPPILRSTPVAQVGTTPPPVHPHRPDVGEPELPAEVGHTVNRSSARGAPPPQIVWALECPARHLTPPHLPRCRVCGRPVTQGTESRPVPRPVLGRVLLPSGEAFALDRGLVFGRAPRVPDDHVGERPHLVKINDPRSEVSAQHLLISLDYWNILVTDLGSTNGTELIHADGQRDRLSAHVAVSVEPGTRIVLAEIMQLIVEATP